LSYNRREPKPEIKNVNMVAPGFQGSSDPRFKKVVTQAPARVYHNDAHGSNMELLKLYTTGPMKTEQTGRYCGECVNFYRDHNIGSKQGRCKARGFLRVSEDTPADHRARGWTDPASGISFSEWPACPMYTPRERLSRK
jgi:hypothetical protein